MKAPNFKILSISAIIMAFFAIACSVVNARNYARLIQSPPKSSIYYHQVNFDPLSIMNEMIRTPTYYENLVQQAQTQARILSDRSIPRYTVLEKNGVVQLDMEIPGVQAKDIQIDLEDEKLLRIKGRRSDNLNNGPSNHHTEFDVTFQLKENVDTSQLKANLAAGILQVQVPNKVKEVKRIPIGLDRVDEDVSVTPNEGTAKNHANVPDLASPVVHTIETDEVVDGI